MIFIFIIFILFYRACYYCKNCHGDVEDVRAIKKCRCKASEYSSFVLNRFGFHISISYITFIIYDVVTLFRLNIKLWLFKH